MIINFSGSTSELLELADIVKRGMTARNKAARRSMKGWASDYRVVDALKNGRVIEAIKVCREITGHGLKEAKDLVEGHPLYKQARRVAGLTEVA